MVTTGNRWTLCVRKVSSFDSPAASISTRSVEPEPECPENKAKSRVSENNKLIRQRDDETCDFQAYSLDLCAVGELLDGVAVLRVVLQQDGHLEGGGLQRVPVTDRGFSRKHSS